jgi:hypothetical protein
MHGAAGNPLGELSADSLYRILGEAWVAQSRVRGDENCCLATVQEMGKQEFDAIVPMLREDLQQPFTHGVVACVATTVHRCGSWRMPEAVVAELAVRLRMKGATHASAALKPK